jgi:hypothetical protein
LFQQHRADDQKQDQDEGVSAAQFCDHSIYSISSSMTGQSPLEASSPMRIGYLTL